MAAHKITERIHSVGILNPGLRVFDVVMRTEYGTTYNSYVVRGSEKTALIETCHATFFDRYIENIAEVTPLSEIDCIVLNHCEPDHSGALERLVQLCPKATIYVSQAGSIYLKNITNRTDLPVQIAKDGASIDLGGLTLRFISAPMLHWPDSMFTWCEEEKALFTCDFFGAHYCEPYWMDRFIAFPSRYERSLKEYFDAIFGPFLPNVRSGLAKAKALGADMFLTSHGPILTRGCMMEAVLGKYEMWSNPPNRTKKLIPLFYLSAYGNTGRIAAAIAEGISESQPDADVRVYDVNEHEVCDMAAFLNASAAFAIGSPTINGDAVPPAWQLLSHVDALNNRKKPALVFGSFGWSGEAVPNLMARLTGLKMNVYGEGLKIQFVPSDDELSKARELGREFGHSIG